MPGRTAHEAYQAFVTPLAKPLACVAVAKIQPSAGGTSVMHRDHHLYLTRQGDGDYVPLKGGRAFELRARMVYRLIEDPRPTYGPIRVTTRAYDYSLRLTTGEAVVDYHWHPDGGSHEELPHLHLGSAQLRRDGVIGNKHHLPTGRITFESVIRTAIELGATPLYDNWAERLRDTEDLHIRHRSWSADPGPRDPPLTGGQHLQRTAAPVRPILSWRNDHGPDQRRRWTQTGGANKGSIGSRPGRVPEAASSCPPSEELKAEQLQLEQGGHPRRRSARQSPGAGRRRHPRVLPLRIS